MSNTVKFENTTLYTIEVPNGVIGFDVQDHTNIQRLKEMYNIIDKADSGYKGKIQLASKKNDTKKDKFGMTEKDNAELKAYDFYINEIEKAIDLFFGEGSCNKIFYEPILNRVSITQLKVELFMLDLLPPHFENAGLKADKVLEERLSKRNRFVKKDKEVIDLDEESE